MGITDFNIITRIIIIDNMGIKPMDNGVMVWGKIGQWYNVIIMIYLATNIINNENVTNCRKINQMTNGLLTGTIEWMRYHSTGKLQYYYKII